MLSATHDVVIVGAGIAGITCALELLEQGRRVLLLDRDSPERLGGLARLSFGGMFAVDTPEQRRAGIHDSVQLALADWRAFGNGSRFSMMLITNSCARCGCEPPCPAPWMKDICAWSPAS